MAGHNSRYKTLLNSSDFPSVVRRLHFTGSKLTIICSLMTTLKTCIRTITYLSDIGCLEIQGGRKDVYEQSKGSVGYWVAMIRRHSGEP